ncbi:hypothetical protein HNP48_001438 [Acidovorax soli]|uniref:Uncharacterized protein n=1 Tax=Acidovorax soli TaxID=592050 RepID=A0A7X0PBJ8_9BURK|nr:hypothetical protein [Acidovorax soli]MBB6558774.1 hypothetical protein [Acidovorax soli]
MAFELVRALAYTELDDHLHMARLLLLLTAVGGKNAKPVDGITKLAKLDFLLRYPTCLERALEAVGINSDTAIVQSFERTTIEAKMVRFRYGPWDPLYRRWLALLVAKRLVHMSAHGRTVILHTTDLGRVAAVALAQDVALGDLAQRARLISGAFGSHSGKALSLFFQQTFPEIETMKWGEPIGV